MQEYYKTRNRPVFVYSNAGEQWGDENYALSSGLIAVGAGYAVWSAGTWATPKSSILNGATQFRSLGNVKLYEAGSKFIASDVFKTIQGMAFCKEVPMCFKKMLAQLLLGNP